MKLDSSFVGTPLKEYRTTVDWRATMNYAAAIDDENPLYFDDEGGRDIVAPPMFAVAATWPVAERIWEYIEVKIFPRTSSKPRCTTPSTSLSTAPCGPETS